MANNGRMSLEQQIDDLYRAAPADFIASRNALARTLKGEDAGRVKRLTKPTVVPWTVNQVYWRSRATYDRLNAAGQQLRTAQVATLKGRAGDVRRAAEAHRQALARAVAEGVRHAEEANLHPNPEELARTLEAVSLARELPEPPGRLTKALQPAGFEALAGVTGLKVKARRAEPTDQSPRGADAESTPKQSAVRGATERKREAQAERKREAAARRLQKEIDAAKKAAVRARTAEQRARTAWERAKASLSAAELTLEALQKRA
jgi:hypothetical protein